MAQELNSPRIRLRHWQLDDLPNWISMNSDPITLRYFPRVFTEEESRASFEKIKNFLEIHDFGLWATEERETGKFMGFIGLSEQKLDGIAFTPCIEIGWRLDKSFWGKGYATEGAIEVLKFGQEHLGISEIFSFTSKLNLPSLNVMRKLGLRARPEFDFEHPKIDEGNPTRKHVVFST